MVSDTLREWRDALTWRDASRSVSDTIRRRTVADQSAWCLTPDVPRRGALDVAGEPHRRGRHYGRRVIVSESAEGDAAAARRGRLVGIKLRALVRDHLGDETVGEATGFAPGAALVHGADGWVLLDDRPAERLGAAIAWALRAGVGTLHVVADAGTGVLARRAAAFDLPIAVWHADGRELWPAVAEPFAPHTPAPEHHQRFRALIVEGGAEPVEEHGVLAGEVRGLEVCRVVDDPDLGVTRLEVGVGAHDREAFTMLHGDVPAAESLARIVQVVDQHRRPGAEPHPLSRLGRERLIRSEMIADPSRVGAVALAAAPPPVPRPNVKDPVPCVAVGADAGGRPVVVVCSSGVDLDLVPFAADARAAHDGARPGVGPNGSRLVIVTPSRDRLPVAEQIAGRLRQPATFVSRD